MKKLLIVAACAILTTISYGQDHYERFKKLLADKDSVGQKTLLAEWEKQNSNDPELYTSYFNYYIHRSMSEVIRLDRSPGKGESLQLLDSANQVAGYMFGETTYNPKYLALAFEAINKGIEKFPNRLDMRFGKIHISGEINDYNSFASEIIKAIDFSALNDNKWQWTKNQAVEDPQEFLLGNIQTYVSRLFSFGNEQSQNIRRIAETTLRHYPDHVISLSNLGVSYILEDNYNKALVPLLAAEKKTPKDTIILANLAYVYMNLKSNEKAIEYYNKVVRFGDADAKRFAEEQLKSLKE